MKSKLYQLIVLFLVIYSLPGTAQDDVVIKEFVTECQVSNNKLIEMTCLRIQINNRAGEGYCNFSFSYKTGNSFSIIEACILDNQGNSVRKLKKKDVTESTANSDFFYMDYMQKKFNLKHNVYPYFIVLKYKREYAEFTQITDWGPLFYNDLNTPIEISILKVKLPSEMNVIIHEEKIEHSIYIENGVKTLQWTSRYNGKLKKERLAPPISDIFPRVVIIPEKFKYGIRGKQTNWHEYGNWEYLLNEDALELPLSEKLIIDRLLLNVNSTREKINVLYHYLQDNNRYINVTIGLGGIKTYPASYVCKNRFGDCKALSNYMVAMLKHAGIEAYYTNIWGHESIPVFMDNLATTSQFNHIIVMVPLENDTLWLECTSKTNPFGYVGTFIQNRYSLPVQEEDSKPVKTPSLDLTDVKESGILHIQFLGKNRVEVHAGFVFRGEMFENLKYIQQNYNIDDQHKILQDNLYFNNYQLIKWDIRNDNRDSVYIYLDAKLLLDNFYHEYGDYMLFKPLEIAFPKFENPDKRTLPVCINYPQNRCLEVVYKIPDAYNIPDTLTVKSMESNYGKYRVEYEIKDQLFSIRKEIVIHAGQYPLEVYADFFSFFEKIQEEENKKLIFTKK